MLSVDYDFSKNQIIHVRTDEYISLMSESTSVTVDTSKEQYDYNIVNTTAGLLDLYTDDRGMAVKKLSDPIHIQAVVRDERNNHFAELELNNDIIRIPLELFLDNKLEATLFNKGITISDNKLEQKALSHFLKSYLSKFEVQDANETLGWRNENKTLKWYGANANPPLLRYKLSLPTEEAYFKELNQLIKESKPLQFVIAAIGAATPLCYLYLTEKIPAATFGISLVGTSSTGKTTAMQLAASFYSSIDDESVFAGFSGTNNALIYMLGKHHGVPICYDETTINNRISTADFIYTFTQGKDKLRLNQDSTLKQRNSWLCTGGFTSENYLVDASKDNLGLSARIITLDNYRYTTSAAHSEKIKQFSGLNYGIVGNRLSDYLLKADSSEISRAYRNVKESLLQSHALNKCHLTDRLVINYAWIVYTAMLYQEIGIEVDVNAIREMCIDNQNKLSAEANPAENIICKMFNYISSKYQKIKGIKWTTSRDGKPIKVAITETTFYDILEESGYQDYKTAVRDLDESGYLIRQSNHRLKSKLSIDGVPCYAYQLDMTKVHEAFGPINDDVFSNVKKYKSKDPFSGETLDITNDEEAIIHAGNYKVTDDTRAIEGIAYLL